MKRTQTGFTMIELIVVIVILGILAATALPKFIDLSGDAKTAAVKGMAGTMGSAMSVNYAGCAAKSHAVTANVCVQINSCEDVASLMQGGTPAEYTVTTTAIDGADAAVANGDTDTCAVARTDDATVTANFTGIAAGN